MKAKLQDLRRLGMDELQIKEKGFAEQLFNLKFEHHTGQLNNPMELRKVKKQLSQIKTLINEKRRIAEGA